MKQVTVSTARRPTCPLQLRCPLCMWENLTACVVRTKPLGFDRRHSRYWWLPGEANKLHLHQQHIWLCMTLY